MRRIAASTRNFLQNVLGAQFCYAVRRIEGTEEEERRNVSLNIYKIPVVLSEQDRIYLTYLGNLRKQRGEQFSDSGLLAAVIDSNISNWLKEEVKNQEFRERIATAVSLTQERRTNQ